MKSAKEILKFVKASLNLFKAVPNLENEKFPEYTLDNEKNLEYGFFVTENAFKVCPCVADEKIIDFIKAQFGYNLFELNQGFYKSFKTVTTLTPQQILANKLLHYFSTYGLESLGLYDKSLVYVPSDALELPKKIKPIKITVIDAIDKSEIEERANKLIMSGVALSKETLQDLMTVVQFLDIDLNIDEVPNKEFAIRLCKFLDILPKNPVQFLRYLIYIGTGSTLLIKSKEVIYKLRKFEKKPKLEEEEDEFPSVTLTEEDAAKLKDFFDISIKVKGKPVRVSKYDSYFQRYIQRNGIDKLARIFHRFKPLWLSFKIHSDYLRSTINKMRKLADKYHKPSAPKFLERVTSAEDVNLEILNSELSNITTYRKISLANAILYRQADPESIVYSIRNGKAFADKFRGKGFKFDIQKVFDAIIKSIAEDMKPNVQGKKIYIPANFTYAVPVSEKKFIGNIPYGSFYTFTEKSCVVGVHWFNIVENGREWRVDLDLHLNSEKTNVGWNNDFLGQNYINTKEEKIIFSGDMTDAPIDTGGATEAFFIGESLTDEFLMVNLNNYNMSGHSVPFKLVLANVEQESIDRQYLIDAHEIAFCVPNEISSGEMFLGFLETNELGEKKFYFFARDMGNRIVARTTNVTNRINSAMQTSAESFLSLNEVLVKAGAIFEDVTAENCDINLDPAEVTKDILIGLLSK